MAIEHTCTFTTCTDPGIFVKGGGGGGGGGPSPTARKQHGQRIF